MTTQYKVVKHVSGNYVRTFYGAYHAKSGGCYYGYDPRTDPHALRQTLRGIRDDLDVMHQDHDLPSRWPRGEREIIVLAD